MELFVFQPPTFINMPRTKQTNKKRNVVEQHNKHQHEKTELSGAKRQADVEDTSSKRTKLIVEDALDVTYLGTFSDLVCT